MPKLLIIDDDKAICRTLELHYTQQGLQVWCGNNLAEGRNLIAKEHFDAIVLDLKLPDGDGIELLREVNLLPDYQPVIMLTGHMDLEFAIEAMKAGAFDYLLKPPDIDQLDLLVKKAISQNVSVGTALKTGTSKGSPIVGSSPAILQLHKQIGLAARSRATILIQGESGSGKELVARAIHQFSSPASPFVAVNCGAIVPGLIESEFFGHKRGAFTGAAEERTGRFEEAGEGTLFLDEIGELPLDMQVKLLRVLQEKVFCKVGGGKSIVLQARVIAATNHRLQERVNSGLFRKDLFYRISPLIIDVLPLRERLSDIPELVANIIEKNTGDSVGRGMKVRADDLERLKHRHWQGNVRELENVIIQSLLSSPGETLNLQIPIDSESNQHRTVETKFSLAEVEAQYIGRVLEQVEWNYGKACEILQISRPTLRKKIADYSIEAKADR